MIGGSRWSRTGRAILKGSAKSIAQRKLGRLPGNFWFSLAAALSSHPERASSERRQILSRDSRQLHRKLNQLSAALELELVHHGVFVERNCARGHIQEIGCFLH